MIKLIRTILFRDTNGNDLRLTLGKIEDMEVYGADDKGFRWRFVGPKIPMPIRSYEWFNGFPEDIMANWVKSQGYEVVATTSHVTGSVYVVKGNETTAPEANKGNEPPVSTGNDGIDKINARTFQGIIKELCDADRKADAIRLYRYAHGGTLGNAINAVNAIRDNP